MKRAILVGCLTVFVFGCAAKKPPPINEPEWPAGTGPGSGTSQTGAAGSPAAAPPLPPPTPPQTTGNMEVLGSMSDSTPGAATATRTPCNLDNCAVVLGISTSQVSESLAQDNGGPGVYVPEGMTSMDTLGQQGQWDAYGIEKLVPVWNVTVLPRNGSPQVIQQRVAPSFGIGDPVLLEGNTILPWN